jgi:hypothetical protein
MRDSESAHTKHLLLRAGILSIAAGLVHGAAAPEHLSEWWGYGLFFLFAATAQVFYGLGLLVQPWRYDATGSVREDRERTPLLYYYIGAIGNASVIVLYLITRTVGIPFFGPEAGEVEPITVLSLLSKGIEIVLIGHLLALIRRATDGQILS